MCQFHRMEKERRKVSLEEISKLLGHKSVMTTFNIYCGVMDADEDARKAVGVMIPCSEEE